MKGRQFPRGIPTDGLCSGLIIATILLTHANRSIFQLQPLRAPSGGELAQLPTTNVLLDEVRATSEHDRAVLVIPAGELETSSHPFFTADGLHFGAALETFGIGGRILANAGPAAGKAGTLGSASTYGKEKQGLTQAHSLRRSCSGRKETGVLSAPWT